MNRLTFTFSIAAGALALVAFVPLASAFTPARAGANQPATTYTVTQKAVSLSPIKVYGLHIPIPLALQLYKKALTRSWSANPADLDKMVCVWQRPVGTHFQTLYCRTNRQHQQLASATQLAWSTPYARWLPGDTTTAPQNNRVPLVLSGLTAQQSIRRSSLAPLFGKLPPANSSYTLRVTDHGKPLFDYIVKHGNLVHIYEYVYKNGQGPSRE